MSLFLLKRVIAFDTSQPLNCLFEDIRLAAPTVRWLRKMLWLSNVSTTVTRHRAPSQHLKQKDLYRAADKVSNSRGFVISFLIDDEQKSNGQTYRFVRRVYNAPQTRLYKVSSSMSIMSSYTQSSENTAKLRCHARGTLPPFMVEEDNIHKKQKPNKITGRTTSPHYLSIWPTTPNATPAPIL
jgi:hypothetical protein